MSRHWNPQQDGTANLVVDSAGALSIDQALTIEANGRLAGDGTVTTVGQIIDWSEIDLGSRGLNLTGGTLIDTRQIRDGRTIDNRLVNLAGSQFRTGRLWHVGNA